MLQQSLIQTPDLGLWRLLKAASFSAVTSLALTGLNGNLSHFWKLMIEFNLWDQAADNKARMRFNNDSGANYQGGDVGMAYDPSSNNAANNRFTGYTYIAISVVGWNNPAQSLIDMTIAPKSGKYRTVNWLDTMRRTNSDNYGHAMEGGFVWRNSADNIISINFDFLTYAMTGKMWLFETLPA